MSRLIDADKLKNHIRTYVGLFTDECPYVNLRVVLDRIDLQPTVDVPDINIGEIQQPTVEQGWIPCSERLPALELIPKKYYLVTCDITISDTEIRTIRMAWIDLQGVWHSTNASPLKGEVIAWAELPQPYKESK